MLEISDKSRKQQLKKIWLECYDDPESYVDFFFEYGFDRCICISDVIDGVAVGVLYLFRGCVSPHNTPGFYWYAGGVLPQYRNKGIYRRIVNYAIELAKKESAVSLCLPGPGLTDFYKGLGLTDGYYCDVFQLKYDDSDKKMPIVKQKLSVNNYCIMSENKHSEGSIIWGKDILDYVFAENEFCNGFCDEICFAGEVYYLFGQIKQTVMHIFETSIPLPVLNKTKDSVMQLYKVQEICVSYPVGIYSQSGGKRRLCSIGDGGFANTDKWFVMTML